ncbi:MAG TPA: chloride channel protein [Thermoanaerobaculia bacterium]
MALRAGAGALASRFREWRRSVEFTLARRFGLATREDRVFLLLIGVVGVLAGLLGVAVHRLIDTLQRLLWGSSNLLEAAAEVPLWQAVAATTVGGVLIGLIVLAARGPAEGPGMGILIESVALRGGRVPIRPILVSSLAAIATVGSGGSLGREGPMIRLGAMLSSRLGTRFRLPAHRVKILVGCGAAAGLAAAYNIPIGGALFAMEVILGNFALSIFGPIVAASVLSTLIARGFEGEGHRFAVPVQYEVESPWEILAYAGLGLVCAFASIAFVLGVRKLSRLLQAAPLPAWLRPVPGMALFGLVAFWVPQILEGGQEPSSALLLKAFPGLPWLPVELALPALFLAVAGVKILAVALTDGCGGVGGKFTPSLFFGALVGGAFGILVHGAWPEATADYPAYAAVGMAAITAGTSHAPISAILILFEFTGNYDLILPLMVACITSSVVSRKLYPYSIYTEALQRKGVDLNLRLEEAVLAGVQVRDLLREDAETLHPGTPYREVVDRFFGAQRQRLFVVGEDGKLLGEISLHDIKHVLEEPGQLTAVVAHDLMRPATPVIHLEDRLDRAAEVFSHSDYERLPVVDGEGVLHGVLSKRDLLSVYAQEVLGRPALLATFVSGRDEEMTRDYVELPPDFSMRLVEVPPGLVGKSLGEARLPQSRGVRVIEIKRGPLRDEERVIPGGDTVLQPGDRLIVLGPNAAVEALAEGRPMEVTEAEAMARID